MELPKYKTFDFGRISFLAARLISSSAVWIIGTEPLFENEMPDWGNALMHWMNDNLNIIQMKVDLTSTLFKGRSGFQYSRLPNASVYKDVALS